MNSLAPSPVVPATHHDRQSNTQACLGVADIEFRPLSDTEWRVSDTRHPAHSVSSLLGFVAHQDGRYFTTTMVAPREAIALPSLDAVAEFFVSLHAVDR